MVISYMLSREGHPVAFFSERLYEKMQQITIKNMLKCIVCNHSVTMCYVRSLFYILIVRTFAT